MARHCCDHPGWYGTRDDRRGKREHPDPGHGTARAQLRASGARGRRNKRHSEADELRALVKLQANETIFILVGQMGKSHCEFHGVSQNMN